jgi:hypothetical protein
VRSNRKKRKEKKSDNMHEWFEFCETRHVPMKQRNSAPRFQTRHLWFIIRDIQRMGCLLNGSER